MRKRRWVSGRANDWEWIEIIRRLLAVAILIARLFRILKKPKKK